MKTVDRTGMPAFLSDGDFDKWILNCDEIIHSLRIAGYSNSRNAFKSFAKANLSVNFSNAIIVKRYGTDTLNSLKERIAAAWRLPAVLKKRINAINEKNGFIKDLQGICGAIAEANKAPYDEVYGKIREWLGYVEFEDCVVANYDDGRKLITFYVKAIENDKAAYEAIFAHELFHAYQYYITPICAKPLYAGKYDVAERRDYTGKVVKEALAVFFEREYCNAYSYPDRHRLSAFASPVVYPYVGACYLNDIYHFNETLSAAFDDFDAALRILFKHDGKIFFAIKNRLAEGASAAAKAAPAEAAIAAEDGWALFKKYLEENHTHNVVNSYSSYVKQAFEMCLGVAVEVIFKMDYESRVRLAESVRAKLTDKINDVSLPDKERKKLRDIRSGVNDLIEFLIGYSDLWTGVSGVPVVEEIEPAAENEYTQEELVRIFKSRINTQDRFYGDCCIPLSVFNRIFKGDKKYREILLRLINSTMFMTEDEIYYPLYDIESVLFKDGLVYIKLKSGAVRELYTEVYKKRKAAGCEKMQTASVSDLSLDHDVPMHKLSAAIGSDPGYANLKKLSDAVLDYKKRTGLTKRHLLMPAFFDDEYAALGIDGKELLEEIERFFNEMSLTVMHRKYNSSKNNEI